MWYSMLVIFSCFVSLSSGLVTLKYSHDQKARKKVLRMSCALALWRLLNVVTAIRERTQRGMAFSGISLGLSSL